MYSYSLLFMSRGPAVTCRLQRATKYRYDDDDADDADDADDDDDDETC
jgi:hypothetical protein